MKDQQKIYWIDNLRVLATISVIFLHVSATIFVQYGSVSDSYWWTAFIYNSLTRFSVPVFLMLTGALMFRKTYEIGDFLKNKFLRIVLPFLFWSIIYIMYDFSYILFNRNIDFYKKLKIILIHLRDGSQYHLWYVYMIIGIYLFIPIISKWIRNATKKEIRYFLIIWFVVMLFNQPYIIDLEIKPAINFRYFSGFMGYLVLGYYLSIKQFNKKWINSIAVGLIVLGLGITFYGTYYLTFSEGKSSEVFYGFLTPNVLILSTGMFFLFKNHNKTNPKIAPVIGFISKYSYGIYLSHVFIINLLTLQGITCYTINPVIGIPLTSILCLTISALLTFIINKIPFGKYVSG